MKKTLSVVGTALVLGPTIVATYLATVLVQPVAAAVRLGQLSAEQQVQQRNIAAAEQLAKMFSKATEPQSVNVHGQYL